MWKLRVTVVNSSATPTLLRIPVNPMAKISDLMADIVQRLARRRGSPTEIVALTDAEGYALDADDTIGQVVENNDKIVAEVYSSEQARSGGGGELVGEMQPELGLEAQPTPEPAPGLQVELEPGSRSNAAAQTAP